MDENLVSVIVPVYNMESYHAQCLSSIQEQTYKKIEIICVDDGSTDSSLEILNSYARQDSRFIIISISNSGVSNARNVGLNAASGKYVAFVDSDDWIDINTYETAVKKAQQTNAEQVMWTYVREYGNTSRKRVIFAGDRTFDEQGCRDLVKRTIGLYGEYLSAPDNGDSLSSVCNKLFLRDLIVENKIRFESISEVGPWEDGMFSLHYFASIKRAEYIDYPFYHYRKGVGRTSKYNPELHRLWKKRSAILSDFITEANLDATYRQSLRNRNSTNVIALGLNALALSPSEAYITIREIISEEEFHSDVKTLPLQYFPLHWKVFFLCVRWKWTPLVYLLLKCIRMLIQKGKTT